MYISKYVFKFSAVSCFKTHLTDYFCVRVFNNDFCGVPKMLLWCCRLFLGGGQQTGCGGRQRRARPWESRCCKKVSVKGRLRWTLPPPHRLPPSLLENSTQMKEASASAFLSFLCASLFLTFFPNCIQNLSGPALLLQYLNTSPGP